MSVDALSWAFRAQVTPMEKLVLLALADRASEFGDCYPSARDIVTRTGLSDRSVRRILHMLAQRGLLSVETRSRDNGATTSNRYLLHVGLAVTVGFGTQGGSPPDTDDPPPLTQTTGAPLTHRGSPPGHTGGGIMNRQDRTVRKEDSATATRAREKPKIQKTAAVPLPPDWLPTDDDLAYARQVGVDPESVLRDFRAYWTRVEGAKGLSDNWSLAWVRWVRREGQFQSGRHPPAPVESSAPRIPTETIHPDPSHAAAPAPRDPRLALVPEDMRAQVEERLNSVESRPIWSWALSQPAIRFLWDDSGRVRTPGFTLGRGILNRVIVEAASAAQLAAVGKRDCETVTAWMDLTEHVGDAAEIAIRTVAAMRARWRSDSPPFSLVPFDADVRRAAAAWNAARAERSQRRTTAVEPDMEEYDVR